MQDNRKQRIVLGTICIAIAALAMGWFVGQYIPGMPHNPEPPVGQGLYTDTGRVVNNVIDSKAGSTLHLSDITQGHRYHHRPQEAERLSVKLSDSEKAAGSWEYECPAIDIAVTSTKIISTKSFAEWYPEYQTQGERLYDDSKLLVVTTRITNTSSEAILNRDKLPGFTLWGANLDYIDDSLGAGALLDVGSFYLINTTVRDSGDTSDNPSNSEPSGSPISSQAASVQPGESQELVLPFKINKNNLKDQSAFDELDPASFCLQTVDYDTHTAYRLWL